MPSRYSRAELAAFANRITTVLREPELRVRGSIRVTPETLIVGAHNEAALKRARSRLAREKTLPQAMLDYRVWKPEEVDGPVTPPRAVYLAVLDTIAAAPPERGQPFVVDLTSMPATVREDDLRQRGLRARSPSDTCGTPTVVSFQQPRQFVDGRYAFSGSWRLNDYYYEVDCRSGACRVRAGEQLPGDMISIGCARAEFPRRGPAFELRRAGHPTRRDRAPVLHPRLGPGHQRELQRGGESRSPASRHHDQRSGQGHPHGRRRSSRSTSAARSWPDRAGLRPRRVSTWRSRGPGEPARCCIPIRFGAQFFQTPPPRMGWPSKGTRC